MANRKVYVTFPKEQVSRPLICEMYDKTKVSFNVRSASVNDYVGIMALELNADDSAQIDKAIAFLKENGLTVDPIEMDVITG